MENQQTPISLPPSQSDYITDSHCAQDENPSLSATEASISFLKFWFDEASDGKIVFFQIAPDKGSVKRAAVLSPADITQEDIVKLVDGQNSYFSICLHDPAKLQALLDSNDTSRGNSLTVKSVHGLWLDVDISGPNHKKDGYPPTREIAFDIMHRIFPFEPTVIIETGGGVHCYWKFRESFEIASEDDRSHIQKLSNRFHRLFATGFRAEDYKLDDVSELARILRLPGSLNYKSAPPVQVRILEDGSRQSYNLSELCEFLPEMDEVSQPALGSHPRLTVEDVTEQCEFLRYAYVNRASLSETFWHATLSNLASIRPGGPELCHKFSQGHPGYSVAETNKKILSAINGSGPITCKVIQEKGFSCQRQCRVKAPAGLFQKQLQAGKVGGGADLFMETFRLPGGYAVSGEKILLQVPSKGDGEPKIIVVAEQPIAVVRVLEDLRTGLQSVTLAFKDRDRLKKINIPRSIISSHDITSLSSHGVYVNPTNSRPLMDFLQRTTKLNEDLIPLITMTRQLGRLEIANEKLFVLGDSYVKNGQILSMCGAASEAMPFELVIDDPGDRQFIQKIHRKGLLLRWVEAAKRLNSFPYAKVAMGAEVASALLEDFEVDNFVMNLGNRTSTGKTTLIEFAASVKGRPDGLFITWDSTTVGFERLAETLNNLLIAVDDTKKIPADKRAKVISSFVYQHASGMGRNRGSLKGRQNLARWRSIMLSTGESTLASIVEDGGAKARVIDLPGMPFSDQSAEIASLIDELKDEFRDNYGHALPTVLAHLSENSENLVVYQERFAAIKSEVRGVLPPGIGTRLADAISILLVSCEVLNDVLKLDWSIGDIRSALIEPCLEISSQGTEGVRALESVHEFAITNLGNQISSRESGTYIEYMGAQVGIVGAKSISIAKKFLRDFLADRGFEPEAVFKEWLSKGWLDVYTGRPFEKQVAINGNQIWCVSLKSVAWAQLRANEDVCDAFVSSELDDIPI